jgi:hypothetical protein
MRIFAKVNCLSRCLLRPLVCVASLGLLACVASAQTAQAQSPRGHTPRELSVIALNVSVPAVAAERILVIFTETGGVDSVRVSRKLYRNGEIEDVRAPAGVSIAATARRSAAVLANYRLEAPRFAADGLYVERIEVQARDALDGSRHRSHWTLFYQVSNGSVRIVSRQEYEDLDTRWVKGIDKEGLPQVAREAGAIPTRETVMRVDARRVD